MNQANVNLPERTAWVSHSTMIAAEDIAAALAEAGFDAKLHANRRLILRCTDACRAIDELFENDSKL